MSTFVEKGLLQKGKYVAGSAEAITAYRQSLEKKCRYDLVFLDLTIPGDIGGIKTLEKLRGIDPEVRAVITSGHVRHDLFEDPRQMHFLDILHKPFQIEELMAVISRNLPSRNNGFFSGSGAT